MKKNAFLIILTLSLLGAISGCGPSSIPAFNGRAIVKDKEAVTLQNSAAALDFKITEFQWASIPDMGSVKIVGTVVNESSDNHQAVRGTIIVFDENNKVLGAGSPFLVPSFVGPGKKAKFEFNFQLPNSRKPESLRLEAVFSTLQ